MYRIMVRIISDSWIYVYISTFVTILYLVGFFLNSTNFQLHHNTLSNNASTDHLFKFQTKTKFVKISIHVTINTKLTAFLYPKSLLYVTYSVSSSGAFIFLETYQIKAGKYKVSNASIFVRSKNGSWYLITVNDTM